MLVDAIHTKALEMAIGREETEAVAISKGSRSSHRERGAAQTHNLFHMSHRLAKRLRRKGLIDWNGCATMKIIVGEAAIETLQRIGRESDGADAKGRAAVVIRAAGYDGVNALTVVSGDILDISHILQASFNLEGSDACIHHGFEVCRAVHILQGEEVTLAKTLTNLRRTRGNGNDLPVCINEVKRQAAELGTFATIGAAAEAVLTGIAATAVADTESSVNKSLQRHFRDSRMDGSNILQGELTGKDGLRVASGLTRTDIVDGAIIHLRGRVKREATTIQFYQTWILNNQGIHTCCL